MQRLAGDFLVKRAVTLYGQGGDTTELYELPNGQWQFGKGRDAVVVTSIEQVAKFDEGTQVAVAAWLERVKHQPKPTAVQQGQTPLLAGDSARDRLSRAISMMSDEIVNRLLTSVEQVLGPVADSITQASPINHHSDGYGQDQGMSMPGSVEAQAFTLPDGAKWADPTRPSSGYLSPIPGMVDDHNIPMMAWHPTPEFHDAVSQPDPIPVVDAVDRTTVEAEMEQARRTRGAKDLVGAGRRARR